MEVVEHASEPHFVLARGLGLTSVRMTAYQGVNLDLTSARAHALCGEATAGRQELLLTLAGRMHRSEGTLEVAGIDASSLKGVRRLHKAASIGIFDNVNEVEPALPVSTIASAELSLAGRPSRRADAEAFLARWNLDGVVDALVAELSSYDLHLLGIALGMVGSPVLLAVQDVERDLTEHQSFKLVSVLRDLARREGVTVVCGATDYDLAVRFDSVTCITDEALAQRNAYQRRHAAREVA